MNYEKIYYNLIDKYKKLNLKKGDGIYLETHHIKPKCIGGDNSKDNLVNLTGKAHFVAHHLLSKMFKTNSREYWGCINALNIMCSSNRKKLYNSKITAKVYERIRSKISEIYTGKSLEERLGEEKAKKVRKKISDSHKGKPRGEVWRKNISLSKTGKKNPNYGKKYTEEEKKKFVEKNKKRVICVETGEVFESIKEAEQKKNCVGVSRVCRGILKKIKGMTWRYYND